MRLWNYSADYICLSREELESNGVCTLTVRDLEERIGKKIPIRQCEGLQDHLYDAPYHRRLCAMGCPRQGYPAIMTNFDVLKGDVLLADIGNGTMNVLFIVNRKPVEGRCWTEKLVVNQCMIRARNAIMDEFGLKIDEFTVEQVLRHGKADIAQRYLDCIKGVAVRYTADIFAALRRYEYDPSLVRLVIVVGGGCLIRNFGEYDKDRVTIIDDLCAAAKGFEALASTNLKRRERHE